MHCAVAYFFGVQQLMNQLPSAHFANLLKTYRQELSLSVRDLASESKVSASLISALENQRRAAGKLTLQKLANALCLKGIKRDEFLTLGANISGVKRVRADYNSSKSSTLHQVISSLLPLKEGETIHELFFDQRHNDTCFDIVAKTSYGIVWALNFTTNPRKPNVLVIPADRNGNLPSNRQLHTWPGVLVSVLEPRK